MEIEVSAFGNFSTDTGSTDCNQVNINVFRFWMSRPSVPHGANFYLILFFTKKYKNIITRHSRVWSIFVDQVPRLS